MGHPEMKPLTADKTWITEQLPDDIPADLIDKYCRFQGYYTEGLKVICEGDRGGFSEVYNAKDDHDLLIWEFKHVCRNIGLAMELKARPMNTPKWRYVRSHVENGLWMYLENDTFIYDTIEDTRLYWFEEYLRMVKSVLSPTQWNDEIKEYTVLMNRWYKTEHWSYDRDRMAFVEISDSRPFRSDFDDSEEPSPEQIIH